MHLVSLDVYGDYCWSMEDGVILGFRNWLCISSIKIWSIHSHNLFSLSTTGTVEWLVLMIGTCSCITHYLLWLLYAVKQLSNKILIIDKSFLMEIFIRLKKSRMYILSFIMLDKKKQNSHPVFSGDGFYKECFKV